MPHTKRPYLPLIACAILIATFLRASAPQTSNAQPAQPASRTFPETGQTIAGDFLAYWNEHGALAQQGYPISPEMQEVSEIDVKSYTVQYFERAKFEKHPEQADPANHVLLELFGVREYRDRYPQSTYPQGAPNQATDTTPGSILFEQTGKRLGAAFLQYWKTHGDVRQQDYPISDVFGEVAEDGKPYRVQYFERAKFEFHTEFAGTTNEVLLSRIGAKFVEKRYVKQADGSLTLKPKATPTAQPSSTPAPTQEVTPPPGNEGLPRVEISFDGGKSVTFEDELSQFDVKVVNSERISLMYTRVAEWMRAHGKPVPNKLTRKFLPPGDTLARAKVENPEHEYERMIVNNFPVRISNTEEIVVMTTMYSPSGLGYMQMSAENYPKFLRAVTANEKFGPEGQDYASSSFIIKDLVNLADYSNIREMLGDELADDLGKREGDGFVFGPPLQLLLKPIQ